MILSLLTLPSCSKDDSITAVEPPANVEPPPSGAGTRLRVVVAEITFSATLANNPTATAFKAMLPLTFHMSDFNSNEKVCSLASDLPTAASNPGTIRTGDIMLYGSNSLVVFYETFSTSYSYTRIGQVNNPSGLKAALGSGNVTITFELE